MEKEIISKKVPIFAVIAINHIIPLGVLTRKGINVCITARITFHVNRLDHARPLLKEMKALNVCEINLIQTLKFMHKTKCGKIHGFSFLNFVR